MTANYILQEITSYWSISDVSKKQNGNGFYNWVNPVKGENKMFS
jgi:hypothetical protein